MRTPTSLKSLLLSAGLSLLCSFPALALSEYAFLTPGVDNSFRNKLQAASLVQEAIDAGNTNPQELLAAARADYGRMVGVLYEAGYFGGVVSIRVDGREAAQIPPLFPPAAINSLTVTVQPGNRFVFGRARVGPLAPGTKIPPGYAPGRPAGTRIIRDAAEAAIDGWRGVGHARASVAQQSIVAEHRQNRLNAELGIAPGPVVTFGRFVVRGNERVSTERIRDIAGFPEGRQFDPAEATAAAKRLRRTGTFRSVAMTEGETLNPDRTLDFEVVLIEEKRRRLGYGVEYSTTDGATLSAFWLHRNLLGGAERLRFDAEISGLGDSTGGIDYSVGARLTRPGTFTPTTDLYIDGLAERKEEPDFLTKTVQFGFGFTKTFSDELSAEAGIRFRYSDVTDTLGVQTEYMLLSLPIEATWDTRDDPLDATEGFFVNAGIEPFLGLSDTASGARITGDARAYRALGERIVLAGRVQIGSIVGASLTGVPPDYRFYSGGGGTVRGHSYQSLGITLPGPQRSGGASLAVLSLEARAKLGEKIGVVGFLDYGYVGANSFPDDTGGSHAGAGLGLRYDTGIGPIRLDVATPVAGAGVGTNIQVYIGIGQAF